MSTTATTGQTFRYYNNFTKSYERETIVQSADASGYVTVSDGERPKRMPAAALAGWELVAA